MLLLILTIVFILIALGACTITGLIKIILFRNQKDTYRHILKFGLLGELIGIIIAMGYLFKPENDKSDVPVALITVPGYLMLVGLLIGSILSYLKGRKSIIT